MPETSGRGSRGWASLAFAAYLTACSDHTPAPSAVVERTDSAGIEIVRIPGTVIETLPLRALSEPAETTVGGEDLEGLPLSRIEGGVMLPGGGIAFADGVLERVVVVDAQGRLVRAFLREGDGPGEVRSVDGLRWRGPGELTVWDDNDGRLLVFDTLGTHLVSIQTPVQRTAQRMLDFPGFLADGSPVFPRREIGPPQARIVGPYRPDFVVDRYRADGAFDAPFTRMSGSEMMGFEVRGGWRALPVALAGSPRLAVGGGRVFVGHGGRFEVRAFAASGLTRIVRVDGPRIPATAADRERMADSIADGFGRATFAPEIRAADIHVADSFPAFLDLVATREGGLWIEEETGRPRTCRSWIVLDPEGSPRARVETPAGMEPLEIVGARMLGVVADPLGVPTVVVHRIAEVEASTCRDVGAGGDVPRR